MDNTLSLGSVIPICVAIVATAGSFLNCVPLVKHPGGCTCLFLFDLLLNDGFSPDSVHV